MSESTPSPAGFKLARYIYSGPVSSITLAFGPKAGAEDELDLRDVHFHHGQEVELPEDDLYVKGLVELGYLAEPAEQAEGAKQPKKKKER